MTKGAPILYIVLEAAHFEGVVVMAALSLSWVVGFPQVLDKVTKGAFPLGVVVAAAPALNLGTKVAPTSDMVAREAAQYWDVVTKVALGLGMALRAPPTRGMVTKVPLSL